MMRAVRKPSSFVGEAAELVRLGLPLASTYLAEFALVFSSMVLIGRLGNVELGAVSLTIDVLYSLLMIPVGIISITSVFAADAQARGDTLQLAETIGQSLLLSFILSVPFVLIAIPLPMIFELADHDANVVTEANKFSAVIWVSIPATLGLTALRHILIVLGAGKWLAVITIAAIVCNIGLGWCLIFGTPFTPGLGVYGAAIGATIVAWAMFLATLVILVIKYPAYWGLAWKRARRISKSQFTRFFRIGGPIGFAALFEYGGFVAIAIIVGSLGADTLAANQMVFNLVFVTSMICYGVGEAAAIRIADARALGQNDRLNHIWRSATAITWFVVGGAALLLLLCPAALVSIFINIERPENERTVTIAVGLMAIAAVFQVLEGLQAVFARLLRGLEETMTAFIASFIGYWLFGVAGGVLTINVFGADVEGVWISLTVGLLMMTIILIWKLLLMIRPLCSDENGETVGSKS